MKDKYNFAFLMVAAGLIALLAILAWGRNSWSVAYLNHSLRGGLVSEAPGGHPRAPLWLAREALAQGDADQAQALVSDLADQGDPDALAVLGDALVAQGDFPAAVEAWTRAGQSQPLLAAAQNAEEEREWITSTMAQKQRDPKDLDRVIKLIHRTGALDSTMDTARELARSAAQELKIFPKDPAREALASLAEYSLSRTI